MPRRHPHTLRSADRVTRYAIGLGANLGDRMANLRGAVESLGRIGSVEDVSALYETAPIGGPEQPPYLNAVAVLDTGLDPGQLLIEVNRIEAEAGRERKERWGARTLDLDIVAKEGGNVANTELTIPHPRAIDREFVLRPLADVWPSAKVGPDLMAADALEDLEPQGVDRLAGRWVDDPRPSPGLIFVAIQFAWFIVVALSLAFDGTVPEGDADAFRIGGALIAFLGGGLAFVSLRRLGDSLTALPEPKRGAAFVEAGTYRYARHPIYGGVFLFLLGTAMIVDSVLGTVLALGLLPFFYLKSTYEERQLRIRYPEYHSYQQRVPRRLIPFVF